MIANLGRLVSHRAAQDGTRVAIVERPDDDGERSITYAELEKRVDAVAQQLALDVPPGQRVAVLGENSAGYLAVVLAAARAGVVAVPMSPRQGPAVADLLHEAAPALVFVEDRFAHLLPAGVVRRSLDDLPADHAGTGAAVVTTPDDVALLMLTSGSSGRPKGVLLSHDALLWPLRGLLQLPPTGLVFVLGAPLFHMNGLQSSLAVLAQGGTVGILDRFEPRRYLRAVARRGAHLVAGVPTMFAMLLDARRDEPDLDLTSVRHVIFASAPSSDELRSRVERLFPQARVVNMYGTTEAFGLFGPHPEGKPTPSGSVGAAQPGVQVRLVDGTDQEGRLVVRTPASLSGYSRDDDATRGKLVDGWFDTGDIARVDADGFYFIVGRADDMINCGGEKLYPAQVEQLLESHPAVRLAAVVPLDDDRKGQVPVAFVVPAAGAMPDPDELKRYALAHGPAYAHPRHVEVLDELPAMGNGKVDKRRLTELASDLLGVRS